MRIFQLPDTSDILQVIRYNHIAKPQVTSNPGDKIPAIYAQYVDNLSKQCPANAADSLTSTPVPSGYIYHVQTLLLYYGGTKAGRLWAVGLTVSGSTATIYGCDTFPTSAHLSIPINLYLTAGSYLTYNVWNAEINQYMGLTLCGVTMRVAT